MNPRFEKEDFVNVMHIFDLDKVILLRGEENRSVTLLRKYEGKTGQVKNRVSLGDEWYYQLYFEGLDSQDSQDADMEWCPYLIHDIFLTKTDPEIINAVLKNQVVYIGGKYGVLFENVVHIPECPTHSSAGSLLELIENSELRLGQRVKVCGLDVQLLEDYYASTAPKDELQAWCDKYNGQLGIIVGFNIYEDEELCYRIDFLKYSLNDDVFEFAYENLEVVEDK